MSDGGVTQSRRRREGNSSDTSAGVAKNLKTGISLGVAGPIGPYRSCNSHSSLCRVLELVLCVVTLVGS